jgi:DNA repair protein RadC
MSVLAEAERARSELLDNPESIYRACADIKLSNQEVLRVILLDMRNRRISTLKSPREVLTSPWLILGIFFDG